MNNHHHYPINVAALKAAAASIQSGNYDEFSANMALSELRRTITEAVGGSLELKQARVLCDRGDCFEYLILDVPAETQVEELHRKLLDLYYESGEYGPDSSVLSLRGITPEGEMFEVPFCGDNPGRRVTGWLSTKIAVGSEAWGPSDVWTDVSLRRINRKEV